MSVLVEGGSWNTLGDIWVISKEQLTAGVLWQTVNYVHAQHREYSLTMATFFFIQATHHLRWKAQ